MKLNLLSFLLFFSGLVFLSSCGKEYSFENGLIPGAAASFSLGGSPNDCTGFVLSGNYLAALPLAANNTVTLDVTVTETGSYSLNTDPVNGISFSGSGEFLVTGSQTVTLTGTGTPTSQGSFDFTLFTDSSNCNFTITVLAPAPVAVATIDCATVAANGTYTQGTALAALNSLTVPVNVTTAGTYTLTSTINGTTYSGAGLLAAGAQNIVLAGTGTPVAAGASTGTVTLGTSTCSYTVTYAPQTTPEPDFLNCNVDGAAKTFNVSLGATSTALGSGNVVTVDGNEAVAANSPTLNFTITNALGTVGPATYNILTLPPSTSFCVPAYIDETGTWAQAAAGQTGTFSIVITERTATRIKGTFSGTLYSASGTGSDTKVFTIGQFSVPL